MKFVAWSGIFIPSVLVRQYTGRTAGLPTCHWNRVTLYPVGTVEDRQRSMAGQSKDRPSQACNWSADSIGRQAAQTDVAKQGEGAESRATEVASEQRARHRILHGFSEAPIGDARSHRPSVLEGGVGKRAAGVPWHTWPCNAVLAF